MNYGEEISYWYFRLNGFFPLMNLLEVNQVIGTANLWTILIMMQ